MQEELTPTERAALLTLELARGAVVTSRQVSARYGVTTRGAQVLLSRIARVVPLIAEADASGTLVWRLFDSVGGEDDAPPAL